MHRTHLYTGLNEGACSKPACMPLLPRGAVLCFDYRTIHRGLPNTSDMRRPMFYVIYAKPWFHIDQAEGGFPVDQPLFAAPAAVSAGDGSG